eukprot:2768905-Pyramimonas_sp.AAC.1
MKAVVTIDHYTAAQGLELAPAFQCGALLGPEEKHISAHWRLSRNTGMSSTFDERTLEDEPQCRSDEGQPLDALLH